MSSSTGLAATIGRASVFIGKMCGPLYAVAIALSVFEVFIRYVLDAPTAWTNETIMAICATAWMFSVGAVTQQNRHITVTVMELAVGPAVWRRMRIVAMLISLVAVVGLLYATWEPAVTAVEMVERSGSAFNPPMPAYLKALLVAACVLYGLQLTANFLAAVQSRTAPVEPHFPPEDN